MAVHKLMLNDVFDEAPYSLIAIHCNIEDYRLAYLLNKQLGIKLTRRLMDLKFSANQSAYSVFEWDDAKAFITWNMVANICKVERVQKSAYNSLFNTEEKITQTTYLIPEHKKINFFLKIEGGLDTLEEQHTINNILKIPRVVTAFSVDADTLKSKDNLIFS
ncbi:MAG: IPExxxVDY family protein [Flavobacteriaceae bacterium]